GARARPACIAPAHGESHRGPQTDGVPELMPQYRASDFGDPGYTGQRVTGGRTQRVALALLRVCLGVFMLFFGFERASWLLDATPLSNQLASWLVDAAPLSRWYLERLIPGAPVFARLVPPG